MKKNLIEREDFIALLQYILLIVRRRLCTARRLECVEHFSAQTKEFSVARDKLHAATAKILTVSLHIRRPQGEIIPEKLHDEGRIFVTLFG